MSVRRCVRINKEHWNNNRSEELRIRNNIKKQIHYEKIKIFAKHSMDSGSNRY